MLHRRIDLATCYSQLSSNRFKNKNGIIVYTFNGYVSYRYSTRRHVTMVIVYYLFQKMSRTNKLEKQLQKQTNVYVFLQKNKRDKNKILPKWVNTAKTSNRMCYTHRTLCISERSLFHKLLERTIFSDYEKLCFLWILHTCLWLFVYFVLTVTVNCKIIVLIHSKTYVYT